MYKAIVFLTNGEKDWEVTIYSEYKTEVEAHDGIEEFKKHYNHSAPFRITGFAVNESKPWYEVDLRSRVTGWSVETIYSGHNRDEAYRVAREWNKEHSGLDINIEDREEYVDGSDGVFADVYENCEPHGVGLW